MLSKFIPLTLALGFANLLPAQSIMRPDDMCRQTFFSPLYPVSFECQDKFLETTSVYQIKYLVNMEEKCLTQNIHLVQWAAQPGFYLVNPQYLDSQFAKKVRETEFNTNVEVTVGGDLTKMKLENCRNGDLTQLFVRSGKYEFINLLLGLSVQHNLNETRIPAAVWYNEANAITKLVSEGAAAAQFNPKICSSLLIEGGGCNKSTMIIPKGNIGDYSNIELGTSN